MKLSNSFAAALVAVLISPTIASTTDELTFNAEEPSSSMSMYDLVSSILVLPKFKVDDESPSDDSNFGRKKHKKQKPDKNMGKLTEISVTVFLATDEDLEGPGSLAMAFLEDDLVYAYNKVQEGKDDLQKGSGSDLQAVRSHFLGKANASEDPDGEVLFPELSKNSRGSVGGWVYTG